MIRKKLFEYVEHPAHLRKNKCAMALWLQFGEDELVKDLKFPTVILNEPCLGKLQSSAGHTLVEFATQLSRQRCHTQVSLVLTTTKQGMVNVQNGAFRFN